MGERVVPGRAPLVGGDVGDPGHRQQEHAAGDEDPLKRLQRGHVVEDEVQRLRQHDAVEGGVGQHRPVGKVADERHVGGVGIDVQDVGLGHVRPTESVRVRRVTDLEHPAADVGGVAGKEAFDVVAVDRAAAGVAEVRRDRRGPPQVTEPHMARRRGHGAAGEPLRRLPGAQRDDPPHQLAQLVHRPHPGVTVMPSTAGTAGSWRSTSTPSASAPASGDATVASFPKDSTSTWWSGRPRGRGPPRRRRPGAVGVEGRTRDDDVGRAVGCEAPAHARQQVGSVHRRPDLQRDHYAVVHRSVAPPRRRSSRGPGSSRRSDRRRGRGTARSSDRRRWSAAPEGAPDRGPPAARPGPGSGTRSRHDGGDSVGARWWPWAAVVEVRGHDLERGGITGRVLGHVRAHPLEVAALGFAAADALPLAGVDGDLARRRRMLAVQRHRPRVDHGPQVEGDLGVQHLILVETTERVIEPPDAQQGPPVDEQAAHRWDPPRPRVGVHGGEQRRWLDHRVRCCAREAHQVVVGDVDGITRPAVPAPGAADHDVGVGVEGEVAQPVRQGARQPEVVTVEEPDVLDRVAAATPALREALIPRFTCPACSR